MVVSPECITMFGKGSYAVIYLNSTHSFLTAVSCNSFVDWDIHFCLLATRFQVLLLVSIELDVTMFIQHVIITTSSSFLKEFSDFRNLVSLVLSEKLFCLKTLNFYSSWKYFSSGFIDFYIPGNGKIHSKREGKLSVLASPPKEVRSHLTEHTEKYSVSTTKVNTV